MPNQAKISNSPEKLSRIAHAQETDNFELKSVMADQAVTNVSGWTEPNSDSECDEETYMRRMASNATVLHSKIKEAMRFD